MSYLRLNPDAIIIGALPAEVRSLRWTLDVEEEGGLSPGYRLKLNSYDLGVDIELYDALNRIRFEHPEVRVVVLTSAKERVFCFRRKYLHARRGEPCREGQFLQIHQRDPQWHRGCERAFGAKIHRRGELARAPAAAMSWRSLATRSSWSTTVRARSACRRWRCSAVLPGTGGA